MANDLLIIDDEDLVRRAVRRMLRDEGFELIHEASNGQEALELLKSLAARKELPRLVITDCDMPKLDGISMVREMRKLPELSKVPIIVCSGDEGNGIIAHQLGLLFFHKGIDDPTALRKHVRSTLGGSDA